MQSMCANVIQLKDRNKQLCVVMSELAKENLEPAKYKELEKHYKIHAYDLSMFEKYGGGSARCLINEVF